MQALRYLRANGAKRTVLGLVLHYCYCFNSCLRNEFAG
jgi:hypothetical protein